MRTLGLFEAKQKLSEIVDHASSGERIGITRRGKLAALIVPPDQKNDLRDIFGEIEKIRKRSRKPKNLKINDLIREGRV